MDCALTLATALWMDKKPILQNYEEFSTHFKRVVDHAPVGKLVGELLIELKQVKHHSKVCLGFPHISLYVVPTKKHDIILLLSLDERTQPQNRRTISRYCILNPQAFSRLKQAVIMAPILKHPNSDLQFDASDIGVGAVLSQQSGDKPKLYPVAYFSKK